MIYLAYWSYEAKPSGDADAPCGGSALRCASWTNDAEFDATLAKAKLSPSHISLPDIYLSAAKVVFLFSLSSVRRSCDVRSDYHSHSLLAKRITVSV